MFGRSRIIYFIILHSYTLSTVNRNSCFTTSIGLLLNRWNFKATGMTDDVALTIMIREWSLQPPASFPDGGWPVDRSRVGIACLGGIVDRINAVDTRL